MSNRIQKLAAQDNLDDLYDTQDSSSVSSNIDQVGGSVMVLTLFDCLGLVMVNQQKDMRYLNII